MAWENNSIFQLATGWLIYIGRLSSLLISSLYFAFVYPFRHPKSIRYRATLEMMVESGNRSLPILLLINFLVGLILAMQSVYQLNKFSAADLVPGLVAITMCREIGPLITAIILSARVGASITAELGTMVVGEEIMALETMALRPIPFLVVPRLVALACMLPVLTMFADAIGMFGGFCVARLNMDMHAMQYYNSIIQNLSLTDLHTGLVKSFGFGIVIATVACHEGLAVEGGAEGVGVATTRSVVISILLIIITDLIFTTMFFL
ncbi:MlaE family lipid ABC transporter permease subunit [bacterium]|nr:MlaE family lipid ABC transporter permease subunit [bacterium]